MFSSCQLKDYIHQRSRNSGSGIWMFTLATTEDISVISGSLGDNSLLRRCVSRHSYWGTSNLSPFTRLQDEASTS
jgi:hypothetical protein